MDVCHVISENLSAGDEYLSCNLCKVGVDCCASNVWNMALSIHFPVSMAINLSTYYILL